MNDPRDSNSATRPVGLDRRTLLSAVGTGAVVGSLAFGTTAAQEGSLDDQLARVTEATEQYADPEAAMDDGYRPMGPFVPGMGWHFMNPGTVQAAVRDGFDIERPQLLTYGDTGAGCDGELVLGSVEYAIPVGQRGYTEDSPPDIFNDDDDTEEWHVHPSAEHVLAIPGDPGADEFPESPADVPLEDQVRTTNWLEIVPGGSPGSPMFEHGQALVADFEDGRTLDSRVVVGSSVHPDLWTLHAWVHHDNPSGVLTETNPTLPATPAE